MVERFLDKDVIQVQILEEPNRLKNRELAEWFIAVNLKFIDLLISSVRIGYSLILTINLIFISSRVEHDTSNIGIEVRILDGNP